MRERCVAPRPLFLHYFGPSRLFLVALVQNDWISCHSIHYSISICFGAM